MNDWKSCDNCGDRSCYEDMKKAGEFDLTVPCDDWSKLPCPICGGPLSEIRDNGRYRVRHCFACNMEFPIGKHENIERKGERVEKRILDVTCGSRQIWFQKEEPHTVYCDKRREAWEGDFGTAVRKDGSLTHRQLMIDPDVLCDFTDLPFPDDSFNLVVFDPPHIENLSQDAWMRKSYGSLDGDWQPMIRKGFQECMRVLKIGGVLVFKWSDVKISTRDIIKVIGQEPLLGHRSGKKMNTHWMCFMKFKEGE